jgi:hypothetical protein
LLPPAGPSVSEFPAYSNKTLYFFSAVKYDSTDM